MEIIRTLGFYQPFGSLMFHGKLETRWVRKSKKPPFPLGRYLFYSTKNECNNATLLQWCGPEIMERISYTLEGDIRRFFNGMALGYGTLINLRLMTKDDELRAFVKFQGEQERIDKNGKKHIYVQWILEFEDSQYLPKPHPFTEGKQGVGILKQPPCESCLNQH